MKIIDKFSSNKTVFSLEVFPPKKFTDNIETVYNTLEQLTDINPDYISVTYSAGGGGNGKYTGKIASIIKNMHGVEPVAHLTCLTNTKEEIDSAIESFKAVGVENILALRGDHNPEIPPKNDFAYSSDLVSYIKAKEPSFGISGACYPEMHMDSKNEIEDILNLKKKVDAGADFLVSQLFFDNNAFYSFVEKARIAGINVPIQAGIMPVTNCKQIERMVSMCGASLPRKFSMMMQKYGDNPEAMRDAGIAYAVNQIVDLIANGVDGIHLYTMNNPYVATKIARSIKNLL